MDKLIFLFFFQKTCLHFTHPVEHCAHVLRACKKRESSHFVTLAMKRKILFASREQTELPGELLFLGNISVSKCDL